MDKLEVTDFILVLVMISNASPEIIFQNFEVDFDILGCCCYVPENRLP